MNGYFYVAAGAIGMVTGFLVGKAITEERLTEEFERELDEVRSFYFRKSQTERSAKTIIDSLQPRGDGSFAVTTVNGVPLEEYVESTSPLDYDPDVNQTDYTRPTEERSYNLPPEVPLEGHHIRVISPEEYAEGFPGNDSSDLTFYTVDGVVTDEDRIPIESPEDYIGDALNHFGENGADEYTVYVRNMSKCMDFEITKVDAAYAESFVVSGGENEYND